jgi:hypothetical protein
MPHVWSLQCVMINFVSIFFSCETFKLYIVNAVKCVLSFGMAVAYLVCNEDEMILLWNWFCFM